MANETITKESRLNSWKETDYNEIRTFIAFLIWMGLDSKPSLPDYWRRTPLYKSDISKYMPRNRFELLLRMFHLANNDECPENDRLHKVQSLVHKMNANYHRSMVPESTLCIDETMIPFRGRLSFRQYIKGKRHKFGIKLFKICLPGGYTNKIKIYCGKEKVNGQPVAERVVMEMIEPLLDEGRTLITDNWYTSVNLAETLQTRSTHLIGTLRKNRKNLPKDVVEAKLKKGEIVAKQNKKNVVVMKWQDKRDVLFLSTKHKDDMIEVTHREGPKRKPAAIIEYNNAKSFVDMSDQRTAYSSSLRKSVKWYRKVAFELITGTSVVNALIIFNKINQTKISVTKFKETVCMQLLQSSNPPLPIQVQQKHELTQNALNKRGRCTICYKRNSELHGRDYAVKNTKRIIYVCNGCEGNPFICLDCFFVNHVFMKRN
nr:unnamed protein product [Callosobruchus chinensis]CAH7730930.1 unnamed protein product [Callosobruchus chinensis]